MDTIDPSYPPKAAQMLREQLRRRNIEAQVSADQHEVAICLTGSWAAILALKLALEEVQVHD